MVKDSISKKDIAKHKEIYAGLDKIKDTYARHVVAGLISQPEFDLGV